MNARQLGLMGLALLTGATDLLIKGLGLALAGLPVLAVFGLLLPLLRRHLQDTGYWFGAMLLAALLTSLASLLLQAGAFELHRALGPYLYLLVLPCLQLAAMDSTAAGGLRAGLVFTLLALLLGTLREALGHASLFAHFDWLLGPVALGWRLQFGADGIPLFALAPGAFILLGTLMALWRQLTTKTADS
ncbi:Rnf-Nqr domain containing protein [Pseudomonas sp. JS3066]|uniref:Rnf-Nqr domain containing protein n=1 Tax=unclassified Pseudomonas TaxID=196821 RepID=UPI000EAA1C39|nr:MULTISPECIES: Rnf-Nqr domain containing protein [unclassified Pseudomonas]AYF85729.1 electron transporter RnfE [Pseudomonas sp. DY-1]WVK91686.1 Rnf-Nqr domain containing protein [Pseudomonas sp. JS3066]